MKQLTTIALLLCSIVAFGQTKPKVDTLSESQVIHISQLLAFGEQAAGSSDKISTNQYNQYHAQVVKIDSVLRSMWVKWHPVKVEGKKQNK